jgi:probable F420-dependent oxidoreductase
MAATPTTLNDPGPNPMKVRIGYGLGTQTTLNDQRFGLIVDELERLNFDSLWLSERINADAPDPLVAMAFGAGRTTHLKFGMSVMVLPGRNPVVLAKSLATLATMSGGRLLPAFGLGAAEPREHQAFGVAPGERAAWFDESLEVMRRCWSGEPVVHHGARYSIDGLTVRPVPKRMEVWLGGHAPAALRRTGRVADGWLPSFITPADAADMRLVIEASARENDRSIDADHFGVLIPYSFTGVPDTVLARLAKRRPDLDPKTLVPTTWKSLHDLIQRFIDVGTTKFVMLPLSEPADIPAWKLHLGEAAETLLPLEN